VLDTLAVELGPSRLVTGLAHIVVELEPFELAVDKQAAEQIAEQVA
jgi:hypothetical protein